MACTGGGGSGKDPDEVPGCVLWLNPGLNAENILRNGENGSGWPIYFEIRDSSGRGANPTNDTGANEPGLRTGLFLADGYTTPRTLLATHRHGDIDEHYGGAGDGQHFANVLYLPEVLDFPDQFSIYMIVANSRGNNGGYDVLSGPGSSLLRQDLTTPGRFSISLGGATRQLTTQVPYGMGLAEIRRDENDRMRFLWNGNDITNAGLNPLPGTFQLSTFGWDGDGSDKYDEYLGELALFRGPVTTADETDLRINYEGRWETGIIGI